MIDSTTALTDVTTAGSFRLLNGTTLGTDFTNRIGRKIIITSIQLRHMIQLENALNTNLAATATGGQSCRMIVFVDNQPNGATPSVADLLVEALPTSMLNLNNRDRFRILIDKAWYFDPFIISLTATQAVAPMSRTGIYYKKYKKCNIETIYNAGNAGTIGDINSGAIYCFWIGQYVNGVNLNVSANQCERLRFVDP